MRINIYAEELTDRIEVISKAVDGVTFTGLRFYLYLPVTTKPVMVSTDNDHPPYHIEVGGGNQRGPFIHREGDDDSAAVTFWGKPGVSVRDLMTRALAAIDAAVKV